MKYRSCFYEIHSKSTDGFWHSVTQFETQKEAKSHLSYLIENDPHEQHRIVQYAARTIKTYIPKKGNM